jgi:hypothetical protein
MATDTNLLETTEGSQPYGIIFQSLAKASMGNGVLGRSIGNTSLKVSENSGGANMTVDVAAGSCIINGTTLTEAAVTDLTVTAASASYDRRDLVVYDQSAGAPAIVDGTANATADPPDVTDDDDIPLAIIYVAKDATSITDADIIDIRAFTFTPYTIASATLRHSNDTEKTGSNLNYIKIKESVLNDGYNAVRIKFDLKGTTSADPGTVYAKIYKNGVAIGTEQSAATGGAYATKSEDFTLASAAGDLIQVYVKASATPAIVAYVQNFRIYYDYEYPALSATSQDP